MFINTLQIGWLFAEQTGNSEGILSVVATALNPINKSQKQGCKHFLGDRAMWR